MSVIKKETIDVRRVGTALIGGDFTGNARGTNTLDIQSARSLATQIASGENCVTIGNNNTATETASLACGNKNTASGIYSTACGYNNTASGYYSTAIGYRNTAGGYYSTACGYDCNANADNSTAIGYDCTTNGTTSFAIGSDSIATANYSNAIGYRTKTRIEKTTNICGPQIIRKDDGEAAAAAFESFCGVEVILMSKEVDMKVVADHTITLPANCHFWLNEIGIIARTVTDLVAQPTVRYGITGDLDKHNAAAITTALTAADKREIETPLVPEDGETSLTAGVTIAADATTFTGRFYFSGMLVEDE